MIVREVQQQPRAEGVPDYGHVLAELLQHLFDRVSRPGRLESAGGVAMAGQVDGVDIQSARRQREGEFIHQLLIRVQTVDDKNGSRRARVRAGVMEKGSGWIDGEDSGRARFPAIEQGSGDSKCKKRKEAEAKPHVSRCYTRLLKDSNVVPSSQDFVARAARGLQASGGKVVFTNGCFDVLHPGHIDLLRKARQLGDALVVAINSDASVRRLKGPARPVFSEDERAELLAALEMVDYVCTFDEDTPLEAILKIRPDILVKGSDWKDNIVGQPEVEGWGGRVVAVPLVAGKSTTGIIERVLDGSSRKTNQ
jgi:D-glycero-beta-D-manno-heptose 1-phosphate adenylyltransferase